MQSAKSICKCIDNLQSAKWIVESKVFVYGEICRVEKWFRGTLCVPRKRFAIHFALCKSTLLQLWRFCRACKLLSFWPNKFEHIRYIGSGAMIMLSYQINCWHRCRSTAWFAISTWKIIIHFRGFEMIEQFRNIISTWTLLIICWTKRSMYISTQQSCDILLGVQHDRFINKCARFNC